MNSITSEEEMFADVCDMVVQLRSSMIMIGLTGIPASPMF